jgi:secernin
MRPSKKPADRRQIPSCDTIVVLGPATRAGATMLAKNSDRTPLECQPLLQAGAARHAEGATVHCQYLEIPQAPETAAVIGSRPFWLFGFEHGINEHGVAIGNEAVMTREELPPAGLLGMDLVRLGLERGRSAREATDVIGALIERWGQGGSGAYDFDFRYSGAFIVADHAEAWVIESSGRQWTARRVTDRACISNRLTSAGFDLSSADVREYAHERGWWRGEEPLDFAAAYAGGDDFDPLFARTRLERSRELTARGGKRTMREMFAMLRDHYEHGETPIIEAPPGSERSFSLCMHSASATTASMVAQLPPPGADAIPVMWAALAAPCTSIFMPLYVDGAIPPALAAGTAGSSNDSPWWRMQRIQAIVARDPEPLSALVREHLRPLENAMLERAAEVGHKAAGMTRAERAPMLTRFMTQNLVRVWRQLDQLQAALERTAR